MLNFDFNLALVLGHSIVYETKNILSPNGIVDDAVNTPGSSPGPVESTGQQMQAYIQNLPQLLQTTAAQAPGVAQQYQNAANATAPQQQALQNQLLQQFGSGLYSTGNALNALNTKGGVDTATGQIQGAGGNLARLEMELQKQLNPEYYSTLGKAGSSLNDLIGSINLNGLSGSERAEVERSNAQQDAQRGIGNAPSQTATVANAMNFGSALAAKRNQLSSIIANASSFLNNAAPSNNPVSAPAVGTGASTAMANPGATSFLGANSSAANNAINSNNAIAGSLLNETGANARSAADLTQKNMALGAPSTVMGSLPNISM